MTLGNCEEKKKAVTEIGMDGLCCPFICGNCILFFEREGVP